MVLGQLFPGVEHLQNIHPLVVHFPIAFLIGAAAFYTFALLSGKDHLAMTAFTCLAVGALTALAAAGTGLYAEPGVMISRTVRARLLHEHKELMLWTTSLAVALAFWSAVCRPFPVKGRPLFFCLLFAMLLLMTFDADYGARMVYDYNAGGSACPQPIEFSE